MAEEKVISFRAQDSNLTSTMNKLRSSQKQSSQELLADAVKYGKTIKDINQYLEEQIKLSQRRAQIIKTTETQSVKEGLRSDLNEAKTPEQRKSAIEGARGALADVEANYKQQEIQTQLLRELIETVKVTAKEEIRESRTDVEKNLQKMTSTQISQLSPEEQIKIQEQKSLLGGGDEKKNENKMAGWVKAAIVGAIAYKTLGVAQQLGKAAVTQSPEMLLPSVLSSLPETVLGSTGEFWTKHIEEKEQQDKGRNIYKALGGKGSKSLSSYGLSLAESYPLMAEVSKTRGTLKDAEKHSEDVIALEKGFNMDKSQIMQLEKFSRYGGSGAMENTTALISRMSKEGFFKGGDYSRLEELTSIQNGLMQLQLDTLGKIDEGQTRNIMVSMNKIGGKFSDNPQYFTQLSNALAQPSSEYAQARNISVLAGIKPGGSWLDIMKMQEKGLFQPKFMSGLMKNIEGRTGGGDLAEIMLSSSLGGKFNRSEVETLWKAYQKDKTVFDGMSSEEDINKLIGRSGVTSRGKSMVTGMEKDTAAISDAFAVSALKGMENGIKQVGEKFGEGAATAFKLALVREKVAMDVIDFSTTVKNDPKGAVKAVWNSFLLMNFGIVTDPTKN